jgi:helicase MOV-10
VNNLHMICDFRVVTEECILFRVVRLTQNFRSHAEILRFPNGRFYDNVLHPCADPRIINSYIGSSLLVNKNFPIVFRALSGQDDREASSPSFFNAMEVLEVKAYIEQLRSSREVRTSESIELSIMTERIP